MKSGFKALAVLLAITGVVDLVMVPIMIQASHHHAGTPPLPAAVLSGVLGAAILASIAGLGQGRRWAFWVTMISLIVNAVNSFLGAVAGPGPGFVAVGIAALVLSVPAIVLLVRRPGPGRDPGLSDSA
jgi:lysylphosphatidylglycerol synthetase-like protein (DUF2156 family)